MSHRCVHLKNGEQCGFYLPDEYPLPVCPWHFTDGILSNKLVALGAGVAIGVGVTIAAKVAPGIWKKLRTKQQQVETTQSADDETDPIVIAFQEAIKRKQASSKEEDISQV